MTPACGTRGVTGTNKIPSASYPHSSAQGRVFCSALLLSLLLGGCEAGPDLPNPAPEFAKAGLSGDWISDPQNGSPGVAFADKDGISALRLTAASERAFVGRRLDSSLIGGPYLRWAWYLETASGDKAGHRLSEATAPPEKPLRLRIAFRGGPHEEAGVPASPWMASGVPPHDRLLDLVWDWRPAATAPGLPGVMPPGCSVPCIPIPKQPEHTDQWWLEAADLEKIYQRFWPEDQLQKVHVVFVALVLEPSPVPMTGYLADLDLRR